MSVTLKTPITYYGGKQTLLRHILPLIPAHTTYTEAFVGGASVYFAKQPAELEVINDVNGNLVNFYKVLQSNYHELKHRIDETLHSRREHEYAQIVYDYPEFFLSIDRAWALWVLSKMSFASKLDGTFGYDKAKNSIAKKVQNAKDQFTIELSKRLEQTQIECTDALRIIRSRGTENTFHFVDPPYIGTDCGHYSGTYNLMDFQNLLELLSKIKGKFMLTMFPHPLMDEFIQRNGWNVCKIERTISASKTNRRKQIELIVCNYTV
ncbi:MAG: DNA adenine methylase [Candidatus Auribacterota bacterium]|jgi:DNA adenine methylase|nr:DNA adenine methylase [Candidatus Auribacterota bacterium]